MTSGAAQEFGEFVSAQEILAAIVNSADDAIYSKDREAIVRSWNPAAERLYGYKPEEILGRSVAMLVPEDHRNEEMVILQRILAGNTVEHYETTRQRKDGSIVPVSLMVSPLRDATGEIVGASIVARDISQVRKARELEKQVAAIVTSTDDAIYSKDIDALITTWNPAAERLYGYTAEEAIGQPVRMIMPEERRGEERLILDRILAGERVDHYETKRQTKDGRIIHVELTASPVHDAHDRIIGASVIARDIADRHKAAAMAQQLERQEFVNLVAHELRSPLAAITGASDLLSHSLEPLEEQGQKLVDMIARQTRVAQRLINDLLDLSRIQSARFEVNLTELRLAEEVDEGLQLVPAPEGKSVHVEVPAGLTIVADEDRFRQVLTNLLGNAYKYGGDEITLVGRQVGDSVELVISDNGEGLSEEVSDRAFEPFVRGRGISREKGSGLGLSITKALMEAFDGGIRYERSESGGAAFVCTFHGSFEDG